MRAISKSSFHCLGKSEILHFARLETTVHVLQNNFKTCFIFFTVDTFESNFIMAGFREIDGLKKLSVKFKTEYKKNCIKLREPNKFYDLESLPLHPCAKALVQICDHKKFLAAQNLKFFRWPLLYSLFYPKV